MPRPTKLTPEMSQQIETALQSHVSIKATCDLVGLSEDCFYRWMREGEAASAGPKRKFYEMVKKARAMSRVVLVNQISKDPSWQAKAWILERQYPQEFGRRQLIAHAGADGVSDLPVVASGPAVNLTIKMQRPDGDAPWIYREGQDEDPTNGSEPWDTDHHGFDPEPPPDDQAALPPLPTAAAPRNPAPGRGPSLPPKLRADQETIQRRVAELTRQPPAIDTGGRPRDPDDH